MVPQDFRKSLCVSAGCFTLLQAIVWTAVTVYSVGVYHCTWDFFGLEGTPSTWTLLYTTYFMGGCRSRTQSSDFTPPSEAASALQVWAWIYAGVSALWLPACILLLVAAVNKVRGKRGATLYYPWVCLTAVLSVLDVISCVFFLRDVFSTMTLDGYAQLTTSNPSSTWNTFAPGFGGDFTPWLPSFFVTLFFGRFFLIWLINVLIVYFVYKASDLVSSYKSKYIQNTLMTTEKRRTWRDKFFEGPDPSEVDHHASQATAHHNSNTINEFELNIDSQPAKTAKQEVSPIRYKTDDFGIPIEELTSGAPQIEEFSPKLTHRVTGRMSDHGRSSPRPESYNERWRDSAPPMASGVHVPPELNKFEPFSYMAGDQPQMMRRPVSRSNSRIEYPPIPRPDYTIADRRSTSLEFVPNRFKVPSPKRPQSQGFSYEPPGSPLPTRTSKIPPILPKKPKLFPRTTPAIVEDPSLSPPARYLPQNAIPSQQPYFTHQTSQTGSYDINKLY